MDDLHNYTWFEFMPLSAKDVFVGQQQLQQQQQQQQGLGVKGRDIIWAGELCWHENSSPGESLVFSFPSDHKACIVSHEYALRFWENFHCCKWPNSVELI